MKWSIFVTAVGLLLVFEGMLPFLSPRFWRKLMQQVFLQSDQALHIMGLTSMLIGLALICVVHHFF